MSSHEEEEELYVNMSQVQEAAAAAAATATTATTPPAESDTESGGRTKAGYLYKQGMQDYYSYVAAIILLWGSARINNIDSFCSIIKIILNTLHAPIWISMLYKKSNACISL